MARVLVSTARFRRAYHQLDEPYRELARKALDQLAAYFQTGHAPGGLGVTKLCPGTFEARAGLGLRIVYVEEGPKVFLTLLGNHDEVRRFLKRQ